jgi:hypothetical protein
VVGGDVVMVGFNSMLELHSRVLLELDTRKWWDDDVDFAWMAFYES